MRFVEPRFGNSGQILKVPSVTEPKRDRCVLPIMAEPTPPETSVHTDAEHARAGETPGIMRYVLGISLLLAVVILSLIVWGPVLFHQ